MCKRGFTDGGEHTAPGWDTDSGGGGRDTLRAEGTHEDSALSARLCRGHKATLKHKTCFLKHSRQGKM